MITWLTSKAGWDGADPDQRKSRRRLLLTEAESDAFRARTDLTVSEWADQRRVLLTDSSPEPGRWKTSTTPYLREPMDDFNSPEIRHEVCCFGTQLGKTEGVLYNPLGFSIDINPMPCMIVYPREDDAKNISRSRLQPMFAACPAIREKIPSKADLYQTLEMHFPGMPLFLAGANSAAGLSQKPAAIILRDEVDKFPDLIGDDADPLSLSEARAKAFWELRKIIDVSSPTVETRGIWKQLHTCDEIRQFQIACMRCGGMQILLFEQIKWDQVEDRDRQIDAARATARYECCHCGSRISEADKFNGGRWVATLKRATGSIERIGRQLSSLYSPWLSWGHIAEEFLRKKRQADEGRVGPLQDFVNGWLAEPWRDRVQTVENIELKDRRCEHSRRTAPAGVVAFTCGIDMQKYGFYYTVWGWERTLRSWMVDHGFLTSWPEIFALIFKQQYNVSGEPGYRHIWRAGIDTGGTKDEGKEYSRTAEAYLWLRENGQGVVHGTKGMSQVTDGRMIKHSIIDKMPGVGGKGIPGGLVLWFLDTDKLKELFFWRLNSTAEDPQPMRFHAETGEDFFSQLKGEEKRRTRQGKEYWHRIGANHYLDASVIAHALADPQWGGGIPLLACALEDQTRQQQQQKQQKQRDEAPDDSGGWARFGPGWVRG